MGEIAVEVGLENVGDLELVKQGLLKDAEVRRTTVRAIADTGAVMLALPEEVVQRLGVEVVGSGPVAYADGRRGELPIAGPLTVHIGDRWTFARCIVVPPGTEALVGQIVMEELDLVADCRNQTLGPRPESPDAAVLRL
ncbi:MAG: clan AA aspartic protease [bacterium]|nr:clan AA aspartic protease [bacterium]MDE0440186.1 clan AA aspartic protease [bacterium]